MAAMLLFGVQKRLEVVNQRMTDEVWSGEDPIERTLAHAHAFVPGSDATYGTQLLILQDVEL